MRSLVLALVALGVIACGASDPRPASAASTTSASPSNVSSVLNAAQPGDTILLASGDYGKFSGAAKSGMVTLRPQAGATVTMAPSFSNAANLTLDGMTISGLDISGGSHDIRVTNSRFTGPTTVDASTMTNADIVFDHDTFDGIDACSSCYEGRLTVRGNNNTAPVGVKITNSHFGNGGGSDGVQIVGNAYGVEIGPGNEFSGIKQGNYAAHVDSIQLYGSSHTQIVGNYFHDDDTIVMAPDGGNSENIANNVMIGDGYLPAVQLGSHVGTQFVHNTVKNVSVHADAKSGASPSKNVVVSNNVFAQGADTNALSGGLCTGCTVSYNLFASKGSSSGTNAIVGTPSFAGGSSPTAWAGYALASGSPGKGNASDGTDRGIDLSAAPSSGTPGAGGGTTTTAAAPAAPAAVIPVSAPSANQSSAVRVRWSFRPAKPRVGTRILLTAPKTKAGGRKCMWTIAKGITRRGCEIVVVYKKAGLKHVSVRITDRSGAVVRGTRDIRVAQRATKRSKKRAAKRHR